MSNSNLIELKITDLNTQCLIAIFKHLNYDDLHNVKRAHPTIFGGAVDLAASDGNFTFSLQKVTNDNKQVKIMCNIMAFFKAFGGKLKQLNIKLKKENTTAYNLLCQHLETLIEYYCVASGTVKHCSFDDFKLRRSFMKTNEKFFLGLESLRLVNSIGDKHLPVVMQLVAAGGIKKIICRGAGFHDTGFNVFAKIAKSRLETCILDMHDGVRGVIVYFNLPKNESLKRLELGSYSYDPSVLTLFPNIEVLAYSNDERHSFSLDPISALPKLKSLKLAYDSNKWTENLSLLSKLADRNSLDSLVLESNFVEYDGSDDSDDDDSDEDGSSVNSTPTQRNKKFRRLNALRDIDMDIPMMLMMMALMDAEKESSTSSDDDSSSSSSSTDEDENNDVNLDKKTKENDAKQTDGDFIEKRLADILCKMTNLKELSLVTEFTFAQFLPSMASHLSTLRKFNLQLISNGEQLKFEPIKSFVRQTPNLTELKLADGTSCKCQQKFYDELVRVRKAQKNEQVLYVSIPGKVRTTTAKEKYVKLLKK